MPYTEPEWEFEPYIIKDATLVNIIKNVKHVNIDNPYKYISSQDIYTIILPDFNNIPLSNKISLSDDEFSQGLDNLLFDFNYATKLINHICQTDSNTIEDYFLRINLTTFKITISKNLITKIYNCINNTRLIIIPIRLDFLNISSYYQTDDQNGIDNNIDNNINSAHSNLLIIDNFLKTIEFFEPHGERLGHEYSNIISIENIIHNFIKNEFPTFQDYNFINVSQTCIYGPQAKQGFVNTTAGHCLAWSLYFIMLRLLNINLISDSSTGVTEKIYKFITSYESTYLDTTIKQFLSYIKHIELFDNKSPFHIIPVNLTHYMENIENVDARLRKLIRDYFLNFRMYRKNFKKIFKEIMSYEETPNFYTILIQELSHRI